MNQAICKKFWIIWNLYKMKIMNFKTKKVNCNRLTSNKPETTPTEFQMCVLRNWKIRLLCFQGRLQVRSPVISKNWILIGNNKLSCSTNFNKLMGNKKLFFILSRISIISKVKLMWNRWLPRKTLLLKEGVKTKKVPPRF